ncbi:hypothetical protein, partial [Microbispora hainanensis]|uniref:hypothetical protein n=1 Tax=Microbispora hainanensis TaxID=568844 RepID=UPI0033DD7F27
MRLLASRDGAGRVAVRDAAERDAAVPEAAVPDVAGAVVRTREPSRFGAATDPADAAASPGRASVRALRG